VRLGDSEFAIKDKGARSVDLDRLTIFFAAGETRRYVVAIVTSFPSSFMIL